MNKSFHFRVCKPLWEGLILIAYPLARELDFLFACKVQFINVVSQDTPLMIVFGRTIRIARFLRCFTFITPHFICCEAAQFDWRQSVAPLLVQKFRLVYPNKNRRFNFFFVRNFVVVLSTFRHISFVGFCCGVWDIFLLKSIILECKTNIFAEVLQNDSLVNSWWYQFSFSAFSTLWLSIVFFVLSYAEMKSFIITCLLYSGPYCRKA